MKKHTTILEGKAFGGFARHPFEPRLRHRGMGHVVDGANRDVGLLRAHHAPELQDRPGSHGIRCAGRGERRRG